MVRNMLDLMEPHGSTVADIQQFMHNGGIADFPLIKRKLQSSLPDVAFDMVQGNTGNCVRLCYVMRANYFQLYSDSEWAFALFLSKVLVARYVFTLVPNVTMKLQDPNAKSFTSEVLRKAMLETISHLNALAAEADIAEARSTCSTKPMGPNHRPPA